MKLRSSDWLIPAGLVALSLVPALAGTARLAELAGGSAVTPENARFFSAPVPVVLHISASIVYSMLGAFQFSSGLRLRRGGWHRTSGRILIPCALAVALSGLWLTVSYPWPEGDGELLYMLRLVFGSAMLLSVLLGVHALWRRSFSLHGEWMIRAYAIGLGAGTQVLTHLPWFLLVDGSPGELPRAVMMGAGWTINVVTAEWIIRRRQPRTHKHLAGAPAGQNVPGARRGAGATTPVARRDAPDRARRHP